MIRRSSNEYITDKAALGIPWADMDTACHAFETVEMQQASVPKRKPWKNTVLTLPCIFL